MYTGRFAPSPTGPLHLGSLIAAAASWLDARAAGGRWLLRIAGPARARAGAGRGGAHLPAPEAAEAILRALGGLGLRLDGEVLYQSRRLEHYRAALDQAAPHTYWCGCS